MGLSLSWMLNSKDTFNPLATLAMDAGTPALICELTSHAGHGLNVQQGVELAAIELAVLAIRL